jgi:ABC-type transporter Mla subunit MlaD
VSLDVCERHDDTVVIWQHGYGKECLLCKAETEIENLNTQVDNERDATNNALDRAREISDELAEANRQIKAMSDSA